MELFKLPAGTVIFKPGDAARQAYLIQQGTVELLRGHAGELVRLTELESGEVFGEMSLIEERPHSLTARAVSAVQLSGLTRDDFENLLTSDPTTFRLYLKILFERLRTLSANVDASSPAPVLRTSGLTVTIHPVTRRAAATLPHDGLPVPRFPFRIGRAAAEHEKIPLDMNDLWLIDEMPFNISRNHASLECEDGVVIVKDRGSSLGIHVNDVHIGGKAGERQAILEDGDNVVVLGGRMSRYQFRINVERA